MKAKLWQDWVLLIAAAWLFLSPFVLGYAAFDRPATWVAFTGALVLFVSASEALVILDEAEEWIDGAVGMALLASPWLLFFSGDSVAAWNTVATGMVVMIASFSALLRDRSMQVQGHRWPAPGG